MEWIDPIEAGWAGDQLDRADVARFLTRYFHGLYVEPPAEIAADGFVLALNASWGFGKSFLLRHWSDDLRTAGYPVVRFDAWESDYSPEPLVGFMAEMEAQLAPWLEENKIAKRPFAKVKAATRKVLPVLAGALGGRAVGELTEQICEWTTNYVNDHGGSMEGLAGEEALQQFQKDIGKEGGALISKSVEGALKEHMSTKVAIKEFKDQLRALIATLRDAKGKGATDSPARLPMFIFIDELDRCRPTYAIELLENVKHLFGVDGVYFVVAINKQQLVHSIRAVYGGAFDASGYLTRFFDQQYELPRPDNSKYAKYLFDLYRLNGDPRLVHPLSLEFYPQPTSNGVLFASMATAFDLSLRDQKQVVARLRAIMAVFASPSIHLAYLLFLLMLHHKHEAEFEKIVSTQGPEYARVLSGIDRTSEFKDRRIDENRAAAPASIPLVELIAEYHSVANINSIALHGRQSRPSSLVRESIANQLRQEAPTQYNRNGHYPLSIAKYPELVRQAGHLV